MKAHNQNLPSRLSPTEPNGIKKLQVGCGPHNLLSEWWNVDLRNFPGIDQVMDVTQPWLFDDLEYIYGEHFLEHLSLEGAFSFLNHAWKSLKVGGIIRLSTPSLEWVISTHFNLSEKKTDKKIASTFAINRAFHGWGHQFLYSKEFLTSMLENLGWKEIVYCEYGKSKHSALDNLERHGKYTIANGYPNVWIVEAQKINFRSEEKLASYRRAIDTSYSRYIRSGH